MMMRKSSRGREEKEAWDTMTKDTRRKRQRILKVLDVQNRKKKETKGEKYMTICWRAMLY